MKTHKWNDVKKSYSFLAIIANIFTCVSIVGLSVVGAISTEMAFQTLVAFCIGLGVIGIIGRFIMQDLEDDGKPFWKEGDNDE